MQFLGLNILAYYVGMFDQVMESIQTVSSLMLGGILWMVQLIQLLQ